jgi:Bacterial antitoxin of type II TA system, VapB
VVVMARSLIERALAVSSKRSKKAVVTRALREFVARREQRRIVELFGTLTWCSSFNYKAGRS